MTELIAAVLGTAAWVSGVLLLLIMAALPLLERFATAEQGE